MIKILKYAIELFWPPETCELDWSNDEGLIFTGFDPKKHVRTFEEMFPQFSSGRTGAGKSSAFLDELRYMPASEYVGMPRENRRNLVREAGHEMYGDALRKYADTLSRWGAANIASGNRTKHAIGIEQQGTAQVLREIADGKPVVWVTDG